MKTGSHWINDGRDNLAIARFVHEGDDFVERIASRAIHELKRTTAGRHLSFASAVSAADSSTAVGVVEALYLHLRNEYHLVYEFERVFDDRTGAQYVRAPFEVGEAQRGTCLDLAALVMSCLANAKLWPVYVHLHGREGSDHALCATWLMEPKPDRQTVLTLQNLRSAVQSGDMLVVDCTGLAEGYPWRQFKLSFMEARAEAEAAVDSIDAEPWGFAIDVRRAWETEGRVSEPRRPLTKAGLTSARAVTGLTATLILAASALVLWPRRDLAVPAIDVTIADAAAPEAFAPQAGAPPLEVDLAAQMEAAVPPTR
jgi:hypothetical protein